MMKKLKESFMLGIVVIVPIVATIMFLKVLINVLSVPFTTFFHHNISPVVSVVISVGIVIFVGILAKNFVGKFIIDFFYIFTRISIMIWKIYSFYDFKFIFL